MRLTEADTGIHTMCRYQIIWIHGLLASFSVEWLRKPRDKHEVGVLMWQLSKNCALDASAESPGVMRVAHHWLLKRAAKRTARRLQLKSPMTPSIVLI